MSDWAGIRSRLLHEVRRFTLTLWFVSLITLVILREKAPHWLAPFSLIVLFLNVALFMRPVNRE